jgi:hypothetical protein
MRKRVTDRAAVLVGWKLKMDVAGPEWIALNPRPNRDPVHTSIGRVVHRDGPVAPMMTINRSRYKHAAYPCRIMPQTQPLATALNPRRGLTVV